MSFSSGPVSKALIATLCTSSLVAAVVTRQYAFVPTLSTLHRLPLHHLVFANSSQLFIAVIVLFYCTLPVERNWGSTKFASFVLVTMGVITVFEALALLLGSRLGFIRVPAGPLGLVFAILCVQSSFRIEILS